MIVFQNSVYESFMFTPNNSSAKIAFILFIYSTRHYFSQANTLHQQIKKDLGG